MKYFRPWLALNTRRNKVLLSVLFLFSSIVINIYPFVAVLLLQTLPSVRSRVSLEEPSIPGLMMGYSWLFIMDLCAGRTVVTLLYFAFRVAVTFVVGVLVVPPMSTKAGLFIYTLGSLQQWLVLSWSVDLIPFYSLCFTLILSHLLVFSARYDELQNSRDGANDRLHSMNKQLIGRIRATEMVEGRFKEMVTGSDHFLMNALQALIRRGEQISEGTKILAADGRGFSNQMQATVNKMADDITRLRRDADVTIFYGHLATLLKNIVGYEPNPSVRTLYEACRRMMEVTADEPVGLFPLINLVTSDFHQHMASVDMRCCTYVHFVEPIEPAVTLNLPAFRRFLDLMMEFLALDMRVGAMDLIVFCGNSSVPMKVIEVAAPPPLLPDSSTTSHPLPRPAATAVSLNANSQPLSPTTNRAAPQSAAANMNPLVESNHQAHRVDTRGGVKSSLDLRVAGELDPKDEQFGLKYPSQGEIGNGSSGEIGTPLRLTIRLVMRKLPKDTNVQKLFDPSFSLRLHTAGLLSQLVEGVRLRAVSGLMTSQCAEQSLALELSMPMMPYTGRLALQWRFEKLALEELYARFVVLSSDVGYRSHVTSLLQKFDCQVDSFETLGEAQELLVSRASAPYASVIVTDVLDTGVGFKATWKRLKRLCPRLFLAISYYIRDKPNLHIHPDIPLIRPIHVTSIQVFLTDVSRKLASREPDVPFPSNSTPSSSVEDSSQSRDPLKETGSLNAAEEIEAGQSLTSVSSSKDSPASVAAADSGPSVVTGSSGSPGASQTRFKVLVAEDNTTNRRILERSLRMAGHTVLSAQHGLQALELYRQEAVDVILMDCNMPEMDGWECTRAIRAIEREQGNRRRLPIIALTAEESPESCYECGMDDFLSKPVNKEKLMEKLRENVHRTTVEAEAEEQMGEVAASSNPVVLESANAMKKDLADAQTGGPDFASQYEPYRCTTSRILLVHIGNLVAHEVVLMLARKFGYRVELAEGPKEVESALLASPDRYFCAVIDASTESDKLELMLQHVRQAESEAGRGPVSLIVAGIDEAQEESAVLLNCGASEVLLRPLNFPRLIQLISMAQKVSSSSK